VAAATEGEGADGAGDDAAGGAARVVAARAAEGFGNDGDRHRATRGRRIMIDALTLLIAIPAALLALALRPVYGLCVYCAVLFCWSQWLTIPLGTLDFTTGRIVILPLTLSVLVRSGGRLPFKWQWLDTWMVLTFAGTFFAVMQNHPLKLVLERQGGWFLDTMLVYFVVRGALKTRDDLVVLIKCLMVIGIPLAVMGSIQAKTGFNPMGFMSKGYAWGLSERGVTTAMRHGFHRAYVTMGVHIVFGLFFAGIAPLVLGLYHQRRFPRAGIVIAYCVLMLGLASSMSSSPYFAGFIAVCFFAVFPLRRFWPMFAVSVVACILFVEIFSNRHFYEVMTRLAFNSDTAYYRVGLIDECFGGGMRGHWLFGYGYVGLGPGNFNANFNWFHKDLVNIYIMKLARYGLAGLLPFMVANVLYYKSLYRAAKKATSMPDQWLIWSVSASLVGWNVAMLTVSAMNQVETLLYILIAVAANMPRMITAEQPAIDPRVALAYRLVLLQRLQQLRAGQAGTEAHHG
jgi:hypothetical protein